MSSSLRLALAAVTLSLLGTFAWLWVGDQVDWSAASHTLSSRLEAILAREMCKTRSITQPVHKPNGFDSSIRQTLFQEVKTEVKPGSVRGLDHEVFRPAADIELAAGTGSDELSAVSRSKDRFNLIVRNKDVSYVLELLNQTGKVTIVALPSVKGPITLTLYDTTIEKALEAILITRGLESRKKDDYILVYTQADIDELDAQSGKIETYTYKPQYISANDLIPLLTPILSEKGKIVGTRANQIGIAANADNAGGDQLAVPDVIVIQDLHAVVERIKKIIEYVDVRPAQVLIEAVILSVELNDDHHLGVNFALLHDNQQVLSVLGNGSAINGAAGFNPSLAASATGKIQGGAASNDHGFKFAVANGKITTFINLLETIGHTTVLASPKVLANNKQRAEIIVGSQLGYRTVTTTETAAVENVQFLDVGTQLRMRPFVQPDGRIRMEIHPEKSSGTVSETTGLPEKDTTQVTTNLTVKSGETIVIGGLIEEQQQRSIQQIPFLGSLPWVGRLFRNESTTLARTELIIMITPRIIVEDEEYASALGEAEHYSKRRDSLERSMPPHIRLALARKYVDRAYRSREQGDLKTAREMVDLALEFDPVCEPALKLKEELASHQQTERFAGTPVGSNEVLRLTPIPPSSQEKPQ